MKVDLHGLPLSEAKLTAQISVAEAWEYSKNFMWKSIIKNYLNLIKKK